MQTVIARSIHGRAAELSLDRARRQPRDELSLSDNQQDNGRQHDDNRGGHLRIKDR